MSEPSDVQIDKIATQCQDALTKLINAAGNRDPKASSGCVDVDKTKKQQEKYLQWASRVGAFAPPESDASPLENRLRQDSILGPLIKKAILDELEHLKLSCDDATKIVTGEKENMICFHEELAEEDGKVFKVWRATPDIITLEQAIEACIDNLPQRWERFIPAGPTPGVPGQQ